MAMSRALLGVALLQVATANDNGRALTPPLGWRSWNLYGGNVNQDLIENIMRGMVNRTRPVWSADRSHKLTSLCDLGYCDVGLDDNWQACHSHAAAPGMRYHAANGTPLVNYARFPDFKRMTGLAHSLGLTSGWYGNNCICHDHCRNETECDKQIEADVRALREYDFDSWKLDGCGGEEDLVTFNKWINKTGTKPITVENCHWGLTLPNRSLPPAEGCPWNLYRSSGDVRASYASILKNLHSVQKLRQSNLSYPGCWAYPDMLQVGCQHGPGGAADPGLSPAETRTHFGAWAIVSSPLTLSHDVNNDTITDAIWDVITNTEALEVNQAYVGDSGGVFNQSADMLTFTDAMTEVLNEPAVTAAAWQYLSKPIGNGRVAVLLMNSGDSTADLEVNFADIPDLTCSRCKVRDIWNHRDLGRFGDSYTASVISHDAAFLVMHP